MSLCLYTPVVHFEIAFANRIESMIDAWFNASGEDEVALLGTVAGRASFAFQQLTNDSEASVPTSRAHAASSSRWMVNVPQMKRTLAVPAPNRFNPSIPASITDGSSHRPR
jgi:hypothetical protein